MYRPEAPQDAVHTVERTFTNCALYLMSEFMGNVERVDCRAITISEGVQYAQYERAVRVRYTPKGLRRVCEVHLTYKPFLMVLSAADAIEPESMFVSSDSHGSSVTLSQGRYRSFDSRWQSDFLAVVEAKGLKPLFKITNDYDTGER